MDKRPIKYLTTKEAAEMLGTTQATIANQARRGDIKGAIMINSRLWLIPEEAIETLVIDHSKSPNKHTKKEG